MCEIIERNRREAAKEAKQEFAMDMAEKMLRSGEALVKIAEYTSLPKENIESIAKRLNIPVLS
ncbi:MAG: hypothetical protein Q4D21_04890 [Phascolarctobacterium sp.]|nr:hypothetical protein [Phascolarctobacterium sp.]